MVLQVCSVVLSASLTLIISCSCLGLYTSVMNGFVFFYIAAFLAVRYFFKASSRYEKIMTAFTALIVLSCFQFFDDSLKMMSIVVFLFFPLALVLLFASRKFPWKVQENRERTSRKGNAYRIIIFISLALGIQLSREIFGFAFLGQGLLCLEIYLGIVAPIEEAGRIVFDHR